MNEVPTILLVLAVQLYKAEKWGTATIMLKTLANEIKNKKAIEILNNIDPLIYYGGDIIPYIPKTFKKVHIEYIDGKDNILMSDLLKRFTIAQANLSEALALLMQDIPIDIPSFIRSIK